MPIFNLHFLRDGIPYFKNLLETMNDSLNHFKADMRLMITCHKKVVCPLVPGERLQAAKIIWSFWKLCCIVKTQLIINEILSRIVNRWYAMSIISQVYYSGQTTCCHPPPPLSHRSSGSRRPRHCLSLCQTGGRVSLPGSGRPYKRYFRCNNCLLLLVYTINLGYFGPPKRFIQSMKSFCIWNFFAHFVPWLPF